MEESSPPPDAESNIFDQFDVQVKGELLPGGAPIVDGYFCRLPPCRGDKRVFNFRRALVMHRVQGHSLPHTGTYKIPEEYQIRQWLSSGKPRPYEIPQRSPEGTKSPDRPDDPPGSSLLSRLLHCKPDTESELQPASLESNIYQQFNVRYEPGEAGEVPYVGYVCLLSQCHEEKVCLNTYTKWIRHRRNVHNETVEVQSATLPNVYHIREWVNLNKPRPYEVPRRRKALRTVKHCPVDPDVFAEFDVKGTVEDVEALQFFCLLDPCKELGISFRGRNCWRKHRVKDHMSPKYEAGDFALPYKDTIKDWMNAGKPLYYKPRRRVRTSISIHPPSKTSTELHNREVDPTPSNVASGNLHKLLSPEGRPSLRRSKSLARLGKLRPSTPQDEVPRESRCRGRSPRNVDAAGCSSDTEHAHQKKKRRTAGAITDSDSSDLVALTVVAHGEDPGGNLWKQLMEKTNPTRDEMRPLDDSDEECDEGTEDVDEETDDGSESVEETDGGSENVDDLSDDQTVEDPNRDHNSADMEEFGEEPHEDSARPKDALPSLPYSQPELHDSGAAEVAEVDEDDHEEFEARDNVLPSQAELQNVKAMGHSSVQSQDFQGVTDEHLQNSTAEMTIAGEEASEEFETPDNVLPLQSEMQNIEVVGHISVQPQDFQGVTDEHLQSSIAELADAEEEAPKDSVAPENVFPSLQNSNTEDKPDCDVIPAEMGEVEEELEDFIAPENALNALAYSQPKLREPSSVQPQDFQGDVLETLPNPTAEMDEVGEEAPEDSVAIENVLPSLSCLQLEFGVTGILEYDNVLPQEFPGEILAAEMAEFGEKAAEEIVAVGNLSLSVQSKSSEQNALSTLGHNNFRDALQFSLEDSPGEIGNHRPNSNAEMAEFEVGEEAPQGFVAPENFMPWIPLMQSEETEVPSLSGPIAIQAAPIQESVPRFQMDQVFIIGPNAAGMAEVGGEAPQGFVAPENLSPWTPLMQSEETELPSLQGPIDIQAAPIQESVPRFHMDPLFIEEPSAVPRVSKFRLEEALEEFGAPRNLVNLLPSNATQETSEQLFLSSLQTNASSSDYSNIENEPIIHEFLWNVDFIHPDIDFMNELAAAVPFAPSTQPEGREIRRIFMDGRTENSTENQVDPIQEPRQEFNTLTDLERAFEFEPDLPLIDDRVIENPEEFFHQQALALALSTQPMQQFFNPGNSESSYNVPAVPALPTDSLDIDMSAGLDYELMMRLDEIPAWLLNE